MGKIKLKKYFFFLLATLACAAINVVFGQVTDTIFGHVINDPYRWLENQGSDSVKRWMKNQHEITNKAESKFNSTYIAAYNNILTKVGYYAQAIEKAGPYYLYFERSENAYEFAPIIEYTKHANDYGTIAFEPSHFFPKQEVNIVNTGVSDDAKYLAVVMSVKRSERLEIRISSLEKHKYLDDKIEEVSTEKIEWWRNGFFYSRFTENEQAAHPGRQQMYYHNLGQPQAQDQLILSLPDSANAVFDFKRTADKKHLIISTAAKVSGKWCHVVEYKDLEEGVLGVAHPIIVASLSVALIFRVVDLIDSNFIVLTDYRAPHFRIMSYKMGELNNGVELVKQFADVMTEAIHINHSLLVIYFDKGQYEGAVFDYKGNLLNKVHFDKGVSIRCFWAAPEDSTIVFTQSSFFSPATAFLLNLKSQEVSQLGRPRGKDELDYTTRIVTYTSKDGTEMPMYLTYKKGLKLKDNNPVLLYSFGNTNSVIGPFYKYANTMFCASNGIVAVPLLRGNPQMGMEWRESGWLLNEQNAIDDLVAAAEYLQKEGYTSKERLAIEGGTLGGSLLAAAAIVQKPDLCRAFVGNSGLYDMIRFPLISYSEWLISMYGSPVKQQYFENLLKYSPQHNLKEGVNYPATLFIGSYLNDYALSSQTNKFLMALQQLSAGNNPHILYFDERTTPPGTLLFHQAAREDAFKISFILHSLGFPLILGD